MNSLKELIALAKAKPGTLNYGSSGPGSNYHMAGELIKNLAGIDIVHVPYKGSTGARTDIIVGPDRHDVRLRADHGADDRGRPREGARHLGHACARRSCRTCRPSRKPAFPATTHTIWIGVMAPAGTPQPIVETAQPRDQQDPVRVPTSRSRGERQGANTDGDDAGGIRRATSQSEIERWAKLIKANNIEAE